MLVAVVEGGQIYTVHGGHLGQPLLMTDELGNEVWNAEYAPFGGALPSVDFDDPSVRYPGQWAEGETALFQNWHRDYDPSLGRYIEADPLGLAAGQSLYGYVGGDPVNFVDPEGLEVRLGYSPAFGGVGSHSFLYSTEYGQPRGRNGSSGWQIDRGAPLTNADASQFPFVPVDIPEGQTEEEFYACIEAYPGWNNGPYLPFADDCQTQASQALNYCGVRYPPSVPTGRTPWDERADQRLTDGTNIVNDWLRRLGAH